MKKKSFLLLGLLLLTLILPGAFAAEQVDVFSVEVTEGALYDGYLVYLKEGTSPRVFPLGADREPLAENVVENLYVADRVEDIRRIWSAEEIVYIEPNYKASLLSVPNDPLFPQQWDMRFINAPVLWESGFAETAGVRIAIIDSGLVQGHEDLNYHYIVPGHNYILGNNDVRDSTEPRTIGHGTRVAGIIAAARNNHRGMAGLLDRVQIVPLKIFDGPNPDATVRIIVQAIRDAVDYFHVDVINMSFGLPGGVHSQALSDALDYAADQGAILVAAVGNDGYRDAQGITHYGTAYRYPAAHCRVVGVGAVDRNGSVPIFSQRNTSVWVTAPGQRLVTLGHMHASHYYEEAAGTSFAAPYVAAMAAIARSVQHDMTVEAFKEVLRRSVVARPGGGRDNAFGWGSIDMVRFLQALPESNWVRGFRDISDHWARESIYYVVKQELFFGTSDYAFSPDQNMSRAMFVTVLGRLYRQMEGGYIPERNDNFSDTQPNAWYSSYVAWAANTGIVSGYGDGRFGPHDNVSRQQAAAIFYRFAQHIGIDVYAAPAVLTPFTDRQAVASWALYPMAWTVEQGIITGIGATLQPNGNATRAQIAVIIERFVLATEISLPQAA